MLKSRHLKLAIPMKKTYLDKLKNELRIMGKRDLLNLLAELVFFTKTVLFIFIYIICSAVMH